MQQQPVARKKVAMGRCKVEQEVDFWASSVCQARRPECNEVLVMQNNDLRMEENFILVLGGVAHSL